MQHAFVFQNAGTGVLKLKAGQTSCSACTIAELEADEVPPGESTKVVVEYKTGRLPKFRQTATILTNDPQEQRVELTISGSVTSKLDIRPAEISFGNVPAGESATAETRIVQHVAGELHVGDPEVTSGGSGDAFEFRVEPLPADELTSKIVGGYRVLATVKPGLPLGPFRRTIRVTLQFGQDPTRSEFEIPIQGMIVSDLSILGPGWRNDKGVLLLGSVPHVEGARRELKLLIRGKDRDSVVIEPIEREPSWLKVTLGERTKLNDAVDQVPLVVEVPPGSPPSIHLGTDQGALGTIVLGVKNHPHLEEIRLHVWFVVD